ncbi:MAG: molybdopterin-dependent oxidoreductase [Myxococcales bacterium]|nr:molybdopterin-dependent oxidoreductase [Myxococcales bacterium]
MEPQGGWSRRQFIQISSAVAGGATVLGTGAAAIGVPTGQHAPDPQVGGIKILRSACMMCNAGCGIQVKVQNGIAIKIDGNPYCPQSNEYASAGKDVVESDLAPTALGTLCARGQAGLKTLYDPLRLQHPLKRMGQRGAGQWQTISWDQAIAEICYGGQLPEGPFEGLAAIRSTAPISAAESKYMDEAPSTGFGPRSNQLVMVSGRNQNSDLTKRFMDAFGSINHLDHTSICNAAYKTGGYHTFTNPKKAKGTYNFKPILENATYVVLFGTNPVEANVPTNTFGRLVASMVKNGGKIVVVDPRFSNTAAKAHRWVPIKPGYEGAFAFGMMRWLIDNGKIDVDFLTRPHEDAAKKVINGKQHYSWSDATYLIDTAKHVRLDSAQAGVLWANLTMAAGKAETVLTVTSTAGFPSKGTLKIGSELITYTGKTDTTFTGLGRGASGTTAADAALDAQISIPWMVISGGQAVPYNTVDQADLEFVGKVNNIDCETSFSMLADEVSLKTVDEYETLCGLEVGTIATVSSEFASAKAPVADMYRGAQSTTNGYYNCRAIFLLNGLMGNVDRIGGFAMGPRFNGAEPARPVTTSTSGVKLDRGKTKYAGTKPKPTRQWYPIAEVGITQEILPSAKIGYPYAIKALMTFTHNSAQTIPFPQSQVAALVDTKAIPLHICSTIFMDETAALADYVLPDGMYLEKWASPMAGYPTIHTKASTIRRPVVGTFDPITKHYIPAFPDTMLFDDVLIRIAVELGLPNFGLNGAGAGKDIFTAWQYYNLFFSGGDYTQGLDEKADYMRMGGKRQNPAEIADPANPAFALNRYGDRVDIFYEKAAASKNALTGKYFSGVPIFEEPGIAMDGTKLVPPAGYDLTLITFKRGWHTQSRTSSNEWLAEIERANRLWINSVDAKARGITNGDRVRVSTPAHTTGEVGRAYVTEEIRPGVVGVSAHFGRREAGSKQHMADGQPMPHNANIGGGLSANHLMWPEPAFPDLCLTDAASGMAAFLSPSVKVEKL